MDVTLKLYASLGAYLPEHALKNEAVVSIEEGASVESLIDRYQVPKEACHLVLLNGVFQPPGQRGNARLKAGDAVAVWPPVAGG
ncbi:MAG: MoaD/ThiS family protein [Alphaproteobacteria bacterium]|nr:MoaD/ThiS family protein [Alphaproteobacteria bacterium]